MRECLGQAAEVDHARGTVQALQRRCGLARKVQLTFVVVFDDDKVVALGACQ